MDTAGFEHVALHRTFGRICFTSKGDCDFLLMGDFNSRTRDCLDCVAMDNSRHVPVSEQYTPDTNELTRTSMDQDAVNNNGRKVMCHETLVRVYSEWTSW